MNVQTSSLVDSDFWKALYNPASIAVIGANNTVGSWGFDALRASLGSRRTGPAAASMPSIRVRRKCRESRPMPL
jgi:hypothetical protein